MQPLGDPNLPLQIAQARAAGDATGVRIGVITAAYSGVLTVALSGQATLVSAMYPLGYVPAIGDYVALVRTGAQWWVLGTSAALPENNQVTDPLFIDGVVGGALNQWALNVQTNVAGTPTLKQRASTGSVIYGGFYSEIALTPSTGAGGSSAYMESQPIPVIPGEIWTATAYSRPFFNNGFAAGATVLAELDISWYSDTTLASYISTVIGTSSWLPDNNWRRLMVTEQPHGSVVPAGAAYMRVEPYASFLCTGAGQNIWTYWARVTAQKIYNADGSLAIGV